MFRWIRPPREFPSCSSSRCGSYRTSSASVNRTQCVGIGDTVSLPALPAACFLQVQDSRSVPPSSRLEDSPVLASRAAP